MKLHKNNVPKQTRRHAPQFVTIDHVLAVGKDIDENDVKLNIDVYIF